MTALVTADWHLSDNPRDEYRFQFVSGKLRELVRRERPRQLLILGDLTDSKDNHNSGLVNRVVEELIWLRSECQLYIMKGNHDYLDEAMPFFKFLGRLEGIVWINEPKAWALEGLGNCVFLPHTRNYKRDWSDLNFDPFRRSPGCGFIFCHNTFEGADAGRGSPLKGIPTKALPSKACVISGDIHVPQKLDQVIYVGAPYRMVFGDEYRPRMLRIWHNKNVPYVETIHYPVTHKIIVEITKPNEKLLPDCEGLEGNLLKIKVHLEADDYARWPEISARVTDWAEKRGGTVCSIQPIKANRTIKLARNTPTNVLSDQELLTKYSKRHGITEGTMKVGLKLMESA